MGGVTHEIAFDQDLARRRATARAGTPLALQQRLREGDQIGGGSDMFAARLMHRHPELGLH